MFSKYLTQNSTSHAIYIRSKRIQGHFYFSFWSIFDTVVFWCNFKTSFYSFTDHSILTAYFHLTLNHIEKNTEIVMSDNSTEYVPAFCLRVATARHFQWKCEYLHRRWFLFNNMVILFLFLFFPLTPISLFLAFTLKHGNLSFIFSFCILIIYACKKHQGTSPQKGSLRDCIVEFNYHSIN